MFFAFNLYNRYSISETAHLSISKAGDHQFSTNPNFSKNSFLTPWYAQQRAVRNVRIRWGIRGDRKQFWQFWVYWSNMKFKLSPMNCLDCHHSLSVVNEYYWCKFQVHNMMLRFKGRVHPPSYLGNPMSAYCAETLTLK